MSFFSSKPAAATGKSEADEIVGRIREEMNQQAAQDLFQRVAEKCFAKCISKPGSKLDANDQACLARCEDRYIDAMNVISQALQDRSNTMEQDS
ncbi:mitochondrial inner membrane translocase subunit Tim13 [Andalucia godoyi]|uniref:Mitochondrial import inner membrane translocase subunit n=1 Tax=Andalucia godoyi TaxID=505711 RepID=A0A8K0AHY1_ANDGO|nr:mitochondrial inner membrane translocase subunit Tim13 [Andalucia godoyi]|eukprot:ANDGO_06366.mRNA.1 mitochondrial inner membrane translocase subunit Tim13